MLGHCARERTSPDEEATVRVVGGRWGLGSVLVPTFDLSRYWHLIKRSPVALAGYAIRSWPIGVELVRVGRVGAEYRLGVGL